jgi:hypothetical protein
VHKTCQWRGIQSASASCRSLTVGQITGDLRLQDRMLSPTLTGSFTCITLHRVSFLCILHGMIAFHVTNHKCASYSHSCTRFMFGAERPSARKPFALRHNNPVVADSGQRLHETHALAIRDEAQVSLTIMVVHLGRLLDDLILQAS